MATNACTLPNKNTLKKIKMNGTMCRYLCCNLHVQFRTIFVVAVKDNVRASEGTCVCNVQGCESDAERWVGA